MRSPLVQRPRPALLRIKRNKSPRHSVTARTRLCCPGISGVTEMAVPTSTAPGPGHCIVHRPCVPGGHIPAFGRPPRTSPCSASGLRVTGSTVMVNAGNPQRAVSRRTHHEFAAARWNSTQALVRQCAPTISVSPQPAPGASRIDPPCWPAFALKNRVHDATRPKQALAKSCEPDILGRASLEERIPVPRTISPALVRVTSFAHRLVQVGLGRSHRNPAHRLDGAFSAVQPSLAIIPGIRRGFGLPCARHLGLRSWRSPRPCYLACPPALHFRFMS